MEQKEADKPCGFISKKLGNSPCN